MYYLKTRHQPILLNVASITATGTGKLNACHRDEVVLVRHRSQICAEFGAWSVAPYIYILCMQMCRCRTII